MSGELRRFIRHPSDIPIEYVCQDQRAPQQRPLNDVGYGGLSFKATEAIPVGQALELSIPSMRTEFKVNAVVAWCRKSDAGYTIGVTFLNHRDVFTMRMVEQVCHIEQYRLRCRRQGRDITSKEAAQEWIEQFAKEFPGYLDASA